MGDDEEVNQRQSPRDIAWGYDGLYRLTSESWTGPQPQSRQYSYDAAANRLSMLINTDPGFIGPLPPSETYHYDALNELTSSTDSTGTTTYSYDLNGNRTGKLTPDSKQTTYVFDTSDRLIEVDDDGTRIFTAAYDAQTRRLYKAESSGGGSPTETVFRYDGGTNFQELETLGDVTTELVRAGGEGGGVGSVLYSDKSVAPTAGPVEYFTYDALGNTVALTDPSGSTTQTTLYDAFGQTVTQNGTSTNNRLRNTKERDSSTGLDDDGRRYYDPTTGGYITRDPSGYSDGLDVYQSVHDDPMNSVDPLGLNWFTHAIGSAAHGVAYAATSTGHAISRASAATVDTVADASGLHGGAVAAGFWHGAGDGAVTGTKAVANATADTVVSTATLGQVTGTQVVGVTDEDRANGYDAAYGFAHTGTSILAGVATGELANAGGVIGETVSAMNQAQNYVNVAQGAASIAQNGLNVQNATQLASGVFGAVAHGASEDNGCGSPETCFVAGTMVLLGDGQEQAIDTVRVGERVAEGDNGTALKYLGGRWLDVIQSCPAIRPQSCPAIRPRVHWRLGRSKCGCG